MIEISDAGRSRRAISCPFITLPPPCPRRLIYHIGHVTERLAHMLPAGPDEEFTWSTAGCPSPPALQGPSPTNLNRRIRALSSLLRHYGKAQILLTSQPQICATGADGGQCCQIHPFAHRSSSTVKQIRIILFTVNKTYAGLYCSQKGKNGRSRIGIAPTQMIPLIVAPRNAVRQPEIRFNAALSR